MAEATSRQHFIECGFAQHQAETLAVEFNRVNQQPSDLSTLKWAVGLAAVATIAGFGWLGSEIRDIRYGLETHIGGLTSRIGGLENNIVGLDARIGGLGTRIDGLETRMVASRLALMASRLALVALRPTLVALMRVSTACPSKWPASRPSSRSACRSSSSRRWLQTEPRTIRVVPHTVGRHRVLLRAEPAAGPFARWSICPVAT